MILIRNVDRASTGGAGGRVSGQERRSLSEGDDGTMNRLVFALVALGTMAGMAQADATSG